MPDLQRSRCSICYGPRGFRAPRFYLDCFRIVKKKFLFYLRMINHVNMIDLIVYKQRVTCEKNDVCAAVTLDTDFDRQSHEGNNCIEPHNIFR